MSTRLPIADSENPDSATEVTGSYIGYPVLGGVRFKNPTAPELDFYDFHSPVDTYPTVLADGPTADEWYQVWNVCDHTNHAFKVYLQGGSEW